MKEVMVSKIKVDELNEEQIIYLKEKDGSRVLPVVIGVLEVQAIRMKLSGVEMPRPLTHDLFNGVIEALDGKILRVLVDKLLQNTFYAKIVLEKPGGKEVVVDARPSDSIAVALRADVPIYVEENILDIAGITPSN